MDEHGTSKIHNASFAIRDSWIIMEILEQFWAEVELNTWGRLCIYMYAIRVWPRNPFQRFWWTFAKFATQVSHLQPSRPSKIWRATKSWPWNLRASKNISSLYSRSIESVHKHSIVASYTCRISLTCLQVCMDSPCGLYMVSLAINLCSPVGTNNLFHLSGGSYFRVNSNGRISFKPPKSFKWPHF